MIQVKPIRTLAFAALLSTFSVWTNGARAQAPESIVTGKWTYRSYISDPDLNTQPNALLFGSGTMELRTSGSGELAGTLGGTGWQLALTGTTTNSTPVAIRFTGKGTINGEEWVYDYLGYVVPKWPGGVDQRPAIVGTIVRTKAHSGGNAPAGYVAQWIAVKHDVAPLDGPPKTAAAASVTPAIRLNVLRMEDAAKQTPYQRLSRQSYLEDKPPASPPPLKPRKDDSSSTKSLLNANVAAFQLQPGSLQPLTLRSQNGRLDVTLNVNRGTTTTMIGKNQVRLRNYNGRLVGPFLRVKPGDSLYITLNNQLDPEVSGSHGVNGHHDWNTTNLHFHGLHVAPQGPPGIPDEESDNVLLEVKPGETKKYKINIPANHVAGTFWYHAHKHGSTAAQVSSGMAGALIVERDDDVHNLDKVPAVAAAREEILLLQQIPYLKDSATQPGEIELSPETDPNPNQARMFLPGSWRKLRRYITVNGEKIPTITMAPGEIRRFRFIYSGQREAVQLRIEDAANNPGGPNQFLMYEIAVDGLPTGSLRKIDPGSSTPRDRALEMFPGYRSDVLVQAPATASGDYYLVDIINDQNGVPRPDKGADGSLEPVRRVAQITISGTPVTMNLPHPTELQRHRLPDLTAASATATRHSYYGLDLTVDPIQFLISRSDLSQTTQPVSAENAQSYNPGNPRPLIVGRTERWLVGSRNNGAPVVHPFHIHINPFLITKVTSLVTTTSPNVPVDVTAEEIGSPTWRDTLAMKDGYTYELLTRYEDFTGSFVDHCHILDHEDNGMMELVRIDPASSPPVPSTAPLSDNPATTAAGVANALSQSNGKPSVLCFVQGSFCPHCMSQLSDMARSLTSKDISVTVISASTEEDLKAFPNVPFRFVADPQHMLFKQNGAFDKEPKHATIVRDRAGKEVFRNVGDEPFVDSVAVLSALAGTGPSFVIAVRGTDDVTDDYITWSPAACTIRMVNGVAGTDPVIVTLTNGDLSLNPDSGELRFATTLAPKSTASLPSVTLQLSPDGTPVSFFIAGVKPSTVTPASVGNGGRDTRIVVHEGNATGPQIAEHLVMVRVRKALRHPKDPLPKASDFEFVEFLKALRDLHQIDNRLEWYVRMHRLATGHGTFAHPAFGDPPNPKWPDLAHQGPAFIAWHRAFLLQFERELQVRYPHVALPYWVQGTPQTIFARNRLGVPATSGDQVDFAPGSPLYGWSISLPMDRGATTIPMGSLRRRALNHDDPRAPALAGFTGPQAIYRQWSDFQTIPNIDRFSVIMRVEQNPHNNGHGTIGPDGIWMSNCRESNADPAFYVFHCNHDYLWAKWQFEYDRFVNVGNDPVHYFPPDEFKDPLANQGIPFGHHRDDTMWPWDGTAGNGPLGDNSNRPIINDFGAFPGSTVPNLWPSAPAAPRPADMIDYHGLTSSLNDLGFCYDSIPFGARSHSPTPIRELADSAVGDVTSVALAVISNRMISTDTRLLAIQSVGKRDEVAGKKAVNIFSEIANDSEQPPDLRSAALQHWFAESPTDAFKSAVNIGAEKRNPLSVRIAAVAEVARQMHFSEIPHSEEHRVSGLLQTILRDDSNPPSLRAIVVRHLAPTGEALAKEAILASLDEQKPAILELPEAVSLLRFFPDQKGRLRKFISSPNDKAVISAILGLYNDLESVDDRKKLARDANRSTETRTVAIQSLMHDDRADLTDFLVTIAADPQVELGLRSEALASATVRLRKSITGMTEADKQNWALRLHGIQAADLTDFGAIRKDAISVVSPSR